MYIYSVTKLLYLMVYLLHFIYFKKTYVLNVDFFFFLLFRIVNCIHYEAIVMAFGKEFNIF